MYKWSEFMNVVAYIKKDRVGAVASSSEVLSLVNRTVVGSLLGRQECIGVCVFV